MSCTCSKYHPVKLQLTFTMKILHPLYSSESQEWGPEKVTWWAGRGGGGGAPVFSLTSGKCTQ